MTLEEAREAAQARIDALGDGLVESYGSFEAALEASPDDSGTSWLGLLLTGEDLRPRHVADWLGEEADAVLANVELEDADDERGLRADLLSMAIRVLLVARLAR